MLAFFGIVLGVVALAGVYGILHDQVTARVCLEYFTIGHPRIIDSTDPTMLALAWGVVATWWFALPFGLVAAGIARFGKGNQLSVAETLRLAALSLTVTGVCAALAGLAAAMTHPTIYAYWAKQIPLDRQPAFMICAWTHLASYVAGGLLAVATLIILAWRRVKGESAA